MSGADIHTVAQLLGHKDLRMAARYQHLSSAFLTEAVGKLDSVFGTVRYQDVTAQNLLTEGDSVSCEKNWQPIRDTLRNFLLSPPAEMLSFLQQWTDAV